MDATLAAAGGAEDGEAALVEGGAEDGEAALVEGGASTTFVDASPTAAVGGPA